MSGERFPVWWSGGAAVVRLPAEVDITVADDMRETLLGALNEGPRLLIVDMKATIFCDSSCITALARAARRAGASGVPMRLAACTPAVLRVLTLTGMHHTMEIYPDVPGAMASA